MNKNSRTIVLFGLLLLIISVLIGCVSDSQDEQCQICGATNKNIKSYKNDDGQRQYFCEDCASKCTVCDEKASRYLTDEYGDVIFVCSDCYVELQESKKENNSSIESFSDSVDADITSAATNDGEAQQNNTETKEKDFEIQEKFQQAVSEDASSILKAEAGKANELVYSVITDYDSVYASSTLVEKTVTHEVSNLYDRDLGKCWCEGKSGLGIGENIVWNFKKEHRLGGITVYNGYLKSEDHYLKNARPVQLRLIFYDKDGYYKSDVYIDIPDLGYESAKEGYYYEFYNLTDIASVKLEIIDAVTGYNYEDTCISEVMFWEKGDVKRN